MNTIKSLYKNSFQYHKINKIKNKILFLITLSIGILSIGKTQTLPTIPITISSNPVCFKQTVTLTTSTILGSVSFDWYDNSNGSPVYLGSGSTITYTPSNPSQSSYNISVSGFDINSDNIEAGAIDFKVYNCGYGCAKCNKPIDEQDLSDAYLSDDIYCLQNHDLYITGNVVFNHIEMIMGKNVRIIVAPNAKLNIIASHLYACADMWQGIVVQPGGYLIIDGNEKQSSFIEDAIVAVDFQMNFGNVKTDENFLNVNNTIFNRNQTGISISDYNVTTPSTTYPFFIKNSLFTCRDIFFKSGSLVWDNLETVKWSHNYVYFAYPHTPAVLSEPYIEEKKYSSYSGYAFLKNGYTPSAIYGKSEYGIVLNNVGISDGIYWRTVIGTLESNEKNTNTVIFDNISKGIVAKNSNLTVYNCTYQKPFEQLKYGAYAVAIDATRKNENNYYLNVINPNAGITPNNAFFDIDYGVTTNYQTATISNCDFRGVNSIPNDDPNYLYDKTSALAIRSSGNYLDNITILDNTIYNTSVGIDVEYFTDITFGNYLNLVDIEKNIIGVNPSGFVKQNLPPYGSCSKATLLNSSTQNSGSSGEVDCISNQIAECVNGIEASYWIDDLVYIRSNTVNLSPDYYNINNGWAYEQEGIATFGGNSSSITYNSVTTSQYSIGNGMAFTTGIHSELQSSSTVECNNISNYENGVRFAGDNTPCKFWDNQFLESNTNGLVLDNSGIIGTNGLLGCASNNQWYGSSYSSSAPPYKTACFNYSDAILSPLWVNTANPITNPDGATYADFSSNFYGTSNGSILAASATTGPHCTHCGTVNGLGNPWNKIAGLQNTVSFATMEDIAQGKINIKASNPALRLYVMQQKLYTSLLQDTPTLNQSSILQNFITTNNNSGFAYIQQVGKALANGKSNIAQNLLNSWTISNTVDNNYKLYYTWLLTHSNYINSSNPVDTKDLEKLANLCPFTDGIVVYAARNLYNLINKKHKDFFNSCSASNSLANRQTKIDSKFTGNVKVYPNPTNGIVHIELPNSQVKYSIEVIDIYGKKILEKICNGNIQQVLLNINTVRGLYLLHISNGGVNTTEKIIVQ